MTPQELDDLGALAGDVREGPFDAYETGDGWYVRAPGDWGAHLVACCDSDSRYDRQMATYIAAACNAAPELVSEVERLTAELAAATAQTEQAWQVMLVYEVLLRWVMNMAARRSGVPGDSPPFADGYWRAVLEDANSAGAFLQAGCGTQGIDESMRRLGIVDP